MTISKSFDRLISLKVNNCNLRLTKKSKIKLGLHFYSNKTKEFSNTNYIYYANMFHLFSGINPSLRISEKDKALKYSLYLKFKPSLNCFRFFSSNFMKYYPSDSVKLMSTYSEFKFIVLSHIAIFKNLHGFNKELYEEKYDNLFTIFICADKITDKRIMNIIF